jgi:hypothetical protein
VVDARTAGTVEILPASQGLIVVETYRL